MNELTGNEARVIYVEKRDWDAKTKLLSSIEKAERLLDYKPQAQFEAGLRKVHRWFIKNMGNIERSVEF